MSQMSKVIVEFLEPIYQLEYLFKIDKLEGSRVSYDEYLIFFIDQIRYFIINFLNLMATR